MKYKKNKHLLNHEYFSCFPSTYVSQTAKYKFLKIQKHNSQLFIYFSELLKTVKWISGARTGVTSGLKGRTGAYRWWQGPTVAHWNVYRGWQVVHRGWQGKHRGWLGKAGVFRAAISSWYTDALCHKWYYLTYYSRSLTCKIVNGRQWRPIDISHLSDSWSGITKMKNVFNNRFPYVQMIALFGGGEGEEFSKN